jgi:hypothetical protein
MPLTITQKNFGNLYVDFEYVVSNRDKLVEYVSQLLMGRSLHIKRIIQGLDPKYPKNTNKENIQSIIDELSPDLNKKTLVYRVDGYLFQMISWIALKIQHKDDSFYQFFPHMQPAMHGFDGIAVTLKPDKSIDKIIITEDKCTENQRKTVNEKVFPEFANYENHKRDNGIKDHLTSLLNSVYNEEELLTIDDNIYELSFRQYRIGLTRGDNQVKEKDRLSCFEGYDTSVNGGIDRRQASTILLSDLRNWMNQFRLDVISFLQSQIN